MAPRFEDLLNEDEAPVRFDDLVQEGGEVEEAPGVLRTFGRNLRQGFNPLWDEGAGFMGANVDAGKHLLETGSVVTPSEWLEGYRRNRDESRDTDMRGAQANPTAATLGRVTGAVAQGIASGGAGGIGRGLLGAVTSGATQGAVNAFAGSEADLTRLRGEEYARAAMDTLGGGATGAAGGAVGYGVGKGLSYVGGKARDAYRGARGTLEAEARAGLDAEADALRAADAAEEARLGQQQGRALEANRRFDSAAERQSSRAARDAQRAAEREARAAQAEAERLERAHGQALEQNRRVDAQRAQADARAARAAQREAEARAVASQREAEALEKAQGQALEMNKAVDARAAREEARRVAQESRAAARAPDPARSAGAPQPAGSSAPGGRRFVGDPNVDPDTRVLRGYEGGARRRRVDNAPKVLDARARLARSDITPAERAELEAYVAGHGNAVDNPPAFRLAVIEEELVKRGYSPDVVRRAMARFDAQGRAVSRSAMQGAPEALPPSAVSEADAVYEQAMRDYPNARNAPPLSENTRARVERDVERVNRGAWDERTMLPERTQVAEGADWMKRGHDMEELARQGGGGSALDGLQDAKTRIGLIRVTPPEGMPNRDNGQMFHRFRFLHPETRKEFEVEARASPHDADTIAIDGIGEVGKGFRESWEENANQFGPRVMRQLLSDLRAAFPGRSRIGGWRDTGINPERGMSVRLPEVREAPPPRPPPPPPDPFHDAPTRAALVRTSPEGGVQGIAEYPIHTFEFKPRGSDEVFEVVAYQPHPGTVGIESVKPIRAKDVQELHGEVANTLGPQMMRDLSQEVARAFPGTKRIAGRRMTGANPGHVVSVRAPEVTQPGTPDFPEVPPLRDYHPPADPTLRFGQDVDLPPMQDAPVEPMGIQRYDVLGARPALRDGQPYDAFNVDMVARDANYEAVRKLRQQNGSAPAVEPTAGARPRAMPESSMVAPMDGPEPTAVTDTGVDPRFEATFAEGTRATRVPEVRRGAMRPEATTVQPPPEATQVGGPSMFSERTRYAPPDMAQRLAGRPSVDELVDQRIAGGGQALRGAFWRGATGESGALAGVAGLALGGPSGSLKALALRGGLEVVREALRNPAAKARAIEAFKLQRLATIRPDVWGRVSSTLQRAQQRDEQAGTDYHLRAARHALLQTDAAFRAAEAEAAKELQGLTEDEVARRLSQ